MEEYVTELLKLGGVEIEDNNNKQDETTTTTERLDRLFSILESWLGMTTTDDNNNNLCEDYCMEDAAPLDEEFYQALQTLLLHTYNPEEASHKYLVLEDPQQQQQDHPTKVVSLYTSILSIRITRLLRFWMDLNVQGSNNVMHADDDDNTIITLTQQLLQNNNSPSLISALFAHVQQLPYLQSQIYLYQQALRKSNNSANNIVGQGLADPQARLQQLQRTQQVTDKLNSEFEQHVRDLEFVLGEVYQTGDFTIRKQCRAHLGAVWSQFEQQHNHPTGGGGGMRTENTSSSGIAMTLRLLHRILLGTSQQLQKAHTQLLHQHLLPLHRPNSMVLWRDQTALLDLYHEPLVQCIAVLIQKQPSLTAPVIAALLEPDVWSKGGNTPKLVLLLHEIDTYIGLLPEHEEDLGDTFPILLRTLGSCMASENSRLAQRALPFVKNKKFVKLLEQNYGTTLKILLPFLLRKEPSWNPTVRKMTYNVLTTLQAISPEQFVAMGDKMLSEGSATNLPSPQHQPPSQPKKRTIQSTTPTTFMPADYTVKSAMGGWKPPIQASVPPPSHRPGKGKAPWAADGGSSAPMPRKNPPLGDTCVAPWAKGTSTGKNPPLGVTGVAPWAMKNKGTAPVPPGKTNGLSGVSGGAATDEKKTSEPESKVTGVLAYMEKIKPPEEKKGASEWSKAQMAETPTLLPALKFHDLVFGHDLGSGSFGVVRYARLIDRTTTRSNWPEYAVKVISTEKIKEMGYEASVQRELAVLRILSHPCISRLVSSFRFHEGVYLILEYASRGDLHSLLRKNGSLDHSSTRFVLGEVVSALASIHELGLVYADLKPENVVITETGHIKLTDFGGSRPVTEAARKMIAESAKNLLQDLRDGDWKKREAKKKEFDMDEDDEQDDCSEFREYDLNEDQRIEGTTNYLPPEVVLGAFPSPAADSWALGCVMYQCLTGRPPIIDDDDTRTKSRIVSFNPEGSKASSSGSSLFSDSHASKVEPVARELILKLLSRDAVDRPTMTQVGEHAFFQDAGVEVFTLYQQPAHPLDVGDVAPPKADAQWSRRQLSSIWAPQPQTYDTTIEIDTSTQHVGNQANGPIMEREEASAFFSKSGLTPVSQSTSSLPPTGR